MMVELDGKFIPAGTTVEYRGHLPMGAVKVLLPDGEETVMNANCFSQLRNGN